MLRIIYTNIIKRNSLFVCLNVKSSGSTGPIYFFLFYMKAAFFRSAICYITLLRLSLSLKYQNNNNKELL